MPDIIARWQDWSGNGIEHLVLHQNEGALATAVVLGRREDVTFAAEYLVQCDREWRTTSVAARLVGMDNGVALSSDGLGAWRDEAEQRRLPALDGAIDVDITCTPFTNTLPIRRL
jgi:hypothetical protein